MSNQQPHKAEARRQAAFHQRNDEFLKLAIEHFHTQGLGNITLTELAARSEYSKGTWYNHFASNGSIIIALAHLNATLQASYFEQIIADATLPPAHQLTSMFFDYVNHAILNPEIWTCGIVARVWHMQENSTPDPATDQLRLAEAAVQHLVVTWCQSHGYTDTDDQLTSRLDVVRAAAAGLCILNVVQSTYTWAQSVNAGQSIDLLTAAMTQTGFQPASKEDLENLWDASQERTNRLSAQWRVKKATSPHGK